MATKNSTGKLLVRASRGETRSLVSFAEPRVSDAKPDRREWLRWARDEQGRWYSFSDFGDAVVESLSGDWFSIVADAAKK